MTDASASKASVDRSLRRFTEDRASEPDNPRHAGWPDLLQPASRRGQLKNRSFRPRLHAEQQSWDRNKPAAYGIGC
jgi:hypothetical protein